MIADLDTLLTALYVELTDRIIPFREPGRRGPGRPPEVTDAELACLAVAQVLLRCDGERHWLRAAPRLVGHLFPRLLAQSQYNTRLRVLREPFALVLRRAGPGPANPGTSAGPRPAPPYSGPASSSGSSPSTPASGTTGRSAPRQAIPDRLRPRVTCPHFPIND
jgi:hypothetical protein